MSDSGWKNFLKGTSFDRRSQEIDTIKPLWTIDLDNEEALIEWHKKISEDLEDSQNERVANYVRNRNLYCGLHYHLGNTVKIARDVNSEWVQSNKSPEIVVNHCYELTEQWVSK